MTMLQVKEFRTNFKAYSDFVDYAALIDDGIMLGKSGALTVAYWIEGEDLGSASAAELARKAEQVNNVLKRLNTKGWMVNTDLIRLDATEYPDSVWPDRTTRLIDLERKRQFQAEGKHYESIAAISLTYTPPLAVEGRIAEKFIDRPDGERVGVQDRVIAYFKNTIEAVELGLRFTLRMRRMTLNDNGTDDLLGYLHYCATGRNHPVRLPEIPMYLDSLIASEDFVGGLEPIVGDQHVRCVGITAFPSESYPAMLDVLSSLPFRFRWSSRFIFMSQSEAVAKINKVRKKWKQQIRGFKDQLFRTQSGAVNQNALTNAQDAELAMSIAQGMPISESGCTVAYGFYTAVIVLMDENQQEVDDKAKEVRRLIENIGFSCRIETVNAVEAFLGTLPGHAIPNVRRPIMHTLNLGHLIPLTTIWAGPAEHPCPFYPPHSPPLFYARTVGSTPFHPTLHVGDVGHGLIIGPTGAGKSTLLCLLAASQFRYAHAKVISFDKGRSMFTLNQGVGGLHYDVGEDNGLQFAPFSRLRPDNKDEITWAQEWVEGLLLLQGVSINPAVREQIHVAVMRHTKSSDKSMTAFVSAVQDKELRQALSYYTLGNPGEILDGDSGAVEDLSSAFLCFEMERLLEKGEAIIVPTMDYIFHRIMGMLDGSPILILVDEAWVAIRNPVFIERFRQWLKEFRKKNAAVWFSTQSLSDLEGSDLKPVLMESCPTKIYLANPEAGNEAIGKLYAGFGLTPTQISIISRMTPKREYYYVSPLGKRVFDLGLGPVALAFCGVSGSDDLNMIDRLIDEKGQAWPVTWLEHLGLHNAAREWAE